MSPSSLNRKVWAARSLTRSCGLSGRFQPVAFSAIRFIVSSTTIVACLGTAMRISGREPSCPYPRFREPNCDRLLLAFHGLAASAALERAGLAALHGALHVFGCGLGIASHDPFLL